MTEDNRLTQADLASMSPAAINVARRAGDLDHLMRPETEETEAVDQGAEQEPETRAPRPNPAQGANGSREPDRPILRREQLRGMSPREINELRRAGKLDGLLGRRH